ncbi:MAG: hypothetical protein SO287_00350 [Parabacteroides sp.]|nr:hypothetical protein [Parabacteroides sp.]MDY4756054.1 hypothetical protein [Parabacteroides sp.]
MRCAPPASLLPNQKEACVVQGACLAPNWSEGKQVCFRKIVQNTFIELSMEVLPDEQERHNLNVFWGFQGENGGDWTWFGARMIHALTENGMIAEAYEELQPMLARVVENNGFNEWYTPAGEPMGSGTFRGEAGVLYKANALLRAWAEAQ